MNQQPASRYDGFSQVLHWVTAIIVTVAFILGPGGFGRLMRQGVEPATETTWSGTSPWGFSYWC